MSSIVDSIIAPRRLLLAAAAAGALVVAGCGSDDREQVSDSEAAAPAAAQETGAASTLDVTETDYAIKAAKGSVEPGAITIAVTNRGQAPHSLAIETPDGVVQTPMLGAGESGEVQADLEPGSYTWYCPVGDHRSRGMEGTLKVGPGGESGAQAEKDDAPARPQTRGYGY